MASPSLSRPKEPQVVTLMNPQFRKGDCRPTPASCHCFFIPESWDGPGARHVQPEAGLPHRDMELPEECQGSQSWGWGLVPKSLLFLQQGAWECGADVPILSLYWP